MIWINCALSINTSMKLYILSTAFTQLYLCYKSWTKWITSDHPSNLQKIGLTHRVTFILWSTCTASAEVWNFSRLKWGGLITQLLNLAISRPTIPSWDSMFIIIFTSTQASEISSFSSPTFLFISHLYLREINFSAHCENIYNNLLFIITYILSLG